MKVSESMYRRIEESILAGKPEKVQWLRDGAVSAKEIKRLKKLSSCLEDADLKKLAKRMDFAHWEGVLCFADKEHEYSYGVLALDRFGARSLYAIPMTQIPQITALPECSLSPEELRIRLDMANQLSPDWQNQINRWQITSGLTAPICESWESFGECKAPYDEQKMVALFRRTPELILVFVAAMDSLFRSHLHSYTTPLSVYNFYGLSSMEWLADVLGALSIPDTGMQPVKQLTISDKAELDTWCAQGDCLTLLRVEAPSAIEQLAEVLNADKNSVHALPLLVSDAACDFPAVVNLPLPANPEPLSTEEKDMIRAAMVRCVTGKFCDLMRAIWNKEMKSQRAELWTETELWRRMLSHFVFVPICPTEAFWDEADEVVAETIQFLWEERFPD